MRRSQKLFFSTIFFCQSIFLCANPALAQVETDSASSPGSESSTSEAARHFDQGLELYDDGALDAALVEFERAYEMVSDYRVLFNLGRVQVERQHFVEAIEFFQRYLRDGGSAVDKAQHAEISAEIQKLQGRVAKLWVEANVEGAELFIENVSRGQLPLSTPVRVNPGVLHIMVQKTGYSPNHQTIKLAGGESGRIAIQLIPLATNDESSSGPPAEPRNDLAEAPKDSTANYTPFWISFSTTVALGGGAAALGILAINTKNQRADELDKFPVDQAEVDSLEDRGRLYAGIADGLMVATAVAAGVSVYFLVAPPKKKGATETGLVSQLKVGASLGQLSLSGQF